MRYSEIFGKSSKTFGSDLSVASHRLLVQAGYIRESVAGRYYLLPLGLKVHHKITEIVRQHMNDAGAQEMVAPILHPLELWQETNRNSAAGFELMQIDDRRGASFALGGTAEEMFVDLVRKFNLSYRDLPFNIYQFGLKFRDELRARGGLLRVREFVMKDAYSFSTPEQFPAVYEQMKTVYTNIFKTLKLNPKVAEADGGYIGGEYCHEFIVDSPVGESRYFSIESGDYIAHEDVAVFDKTIKPKSQKTEPLKQVSAKRGPTMADSQKLHSPVPIEQHIKNVVYINEHETLILACLRGDLDVNETKLMQVFQCHQLTPLTPDQVRDWLSSEPGFISAVNLKGRVKGHKLVIVADDSLLSVVNAISGANKLDKDYININIGRDFEADMSADIAMAKQGFKTKDGQELTEHRGVEVGQIFQLGYHYTDKMTGAEYTDESGKRQKYYMGCYGIGIGRTMATIAEVYGDERGLYWPAAVAPYQIYLATLGDSKEIQAQAAKVEAHLAKQGFEVLYDNRADVSSGEKLTNADLLGMPIRVVISQRSLKEDGVEVKHRQSKQAQTVGIEKLSSTVTNLLDTLEPNF